MDEPAPQRPAPHPSAPSGRLVDITLDEATIRQVSPEIAMEQRTAIHDLLLDNAFTPVADAQTGGDYKLALSLRDGRLVFAITRAASEGDGEDVEAAKTLTHALSLTPLRRVMRDYWAIFESYTENAAHMSPAQLEAIDMGRRGAHDEGAAILAERLEGKIVLDKATARRLFTLICALQWRGPLR